MNKCTAQASTYPGRVVIKLNLFLTIFIRLVPTAVLALLFVLWWSIEREVSS